MNKLTKAMLAPFRKALDWYVSNGFYRMASRMLEWGSQSNSGELVTFDSAMGHGAFFACTRVVCETLGSLPLDLMQQRGDSRRVASEVSLHGLLKHAPNPWMNAINFREALTADALIRGNGFAQIVRRSGSGDILQLIPIPSMMIEIEFTEDRVPRYKLHRKTGPPEEMTLGENLFHLVGFSHDGFTGLPLLRYIRETMGLAQSADKYASKFYANGGRVPYVLEHPQKFKSDADFARFVEQWRAAYGNADVFHVAPVLEGGLTYKQIGLSAEDSQFLATRAANPSEICRWFRLSPHLIGDLSRATYNNIEHLGLEFVQYNQLPWAVRWEQAIWRCLLTERQRTQGYYAKHNFSALLRGDFVSRMQGYATALQNGHLSVNEVRALEDRDPVEGGDALHLQLNMQTLPGSGEPTTSERTQLIKISEGRPRGGNSNA
jgi:HK97 family phage portal protein